MPEIGYTLVLIVALMAVAWFAVFAVTRLCRGQR
jgi:hypothetical protein